MTTKELQIKLHKLHKAQIELSIVRDKILVLEGDATVSFTAQLLEEDYKRLSNEVCELQAQVTLAQVIDA